jgi:integrase
LGRKKEGTVLERSWKSGRGYALRFIAYGERQYLSLGSEHDGWTRQRADEELANIMADVRRGIWVPPNRNTSKAATATDDAPPTAEPTFGAFASERLVARKREVAERTHEYEQWAITRHLLPYFATWPLSDITIEAVDEYRGFKAEQAEQLRAAMARKRPPRDDRKMLIRPLSAGSINKTIDVLQSYLQVAVEYGHLPANPAAGRRRRLKTPGRRPVHLDTVQHITALLEAAGQLDAATISRLHDRRAAIATLMFAGPRATEHTNLLWADADLTNDRIEIGRSKTAAGLREIHLLPILKQVLITHKQASDRTGPGDLVFASRDGTQRDKDNLRNRVLAPAIDRADDLLIARGQPPLPAGLTPHKLRHTFASILVACGEDPASVMAQLGHTDPAFTLRIYTHLMRRDPAERARLKALVYDQPLDQTTKPSDDDTIDEAA